MNDIKNFEEFNDFISEKKIDGLSNKNLTYSEQEVMLSFSELTTGIDNITIWIGPNPHSNIQRIKVNNGPDGINCFSITIPDLEIVGDINNVNHTHRDLKDIKKFIKLNYDIIVKIMNDEESISLLVKKLKKVR